MRSLKLLVLGASVSEGGEFNIGTVNKMGNNGTNRPRVSQNSMPDQPDTVLTASPAVIYTALPSDRSRLTYISANAEERFGQPGTALLDSPGLLLDQIHPDDRALASEAFAVAADTRRQAVTYRLRNGTGDYRWIRDEMRTIRDEDGRAVEIVGCLTDVTELKESEQRLHARIDELEERVHHRTRELSELNDNLRKEEGERQRQAIDLAATEHGYRALVDLSPNIICIVCDGVVDFVNNAGATLFGASDHTEVIGRPILDFVHPDDLPLVSKRMEELENSDEAVPFQETKLVRLDASTFDAEVAAVPFTYKGKPAIQVVARDITDRRELEQQLRQSQKMEAIGHLAGGVAHEYNNLLTVIMSYAEMLEHRLHADQGALHDIREIRRAADRAADLTAELLAFGRRQVLRPEILDLNDVVRKAEAMLRHVIGEDVELVMSCVAGHATVRADPAQFEQAIVNLVLNARDAMPNGGRLTIQTARSDLEEPDQHDQYVIPPGPYAMLVVSDTGIGMDEATVARIFEPFFTTAPVGEASGLGLSTVYGIVKQSGGYVQCDSRVGSGTTFRVYLPREDEAALTPAPAESHTQPLRGLETILIVEDEKVVRDTTRRILTRCGYDVLEAADGAQALQVCEQHPDAIALVVTDVVMPRMSGLQLAEHIADVRPDTKILFVSGYAKASLTNDREISSNMEFLQKPYTPRVLREKVCDILNETSRTASAGV